MPDGAPAKPFVTSGGGYFMLPTGPATGTATASSASADTYGSWVEFDAVVAAAIFVVGYTIHAIAASSSTYIQVDIGVGAAASEVSAGEGIVAIDPGDTIDAFKGGIVNFVLPIPVALNARLACRTADSEASARAWPVTLHCILQSDVKVL